MLHELRVISPTTWIRRFPERVQSTVFRELCDKVTSIQRQLHPNNRKPRILRDQLYFAAVALENFSRALKKSVRTTAHDPMQKIGTFLSNELESAGAHVEKSGDVCYGLSRRFGGKTEDGRQKLQLIQRQVYEKSL